MNTAHRHTLLTLFAIAEGATGLGLVVAPSILFVLLFEARPVASEAPLIARICGAALLALAAASWGGTPKTGEARWGSSSAWRSIIS
ncbi:hypothetical protein [Rhizobium leguminosarum]|uniref:hypothetical protein n=1 Tax=Rhizobium leguminosarum TaxID=384 RepID=UPI0021BC2A56|nr:hypothetical protein [Rhizobium leguminosarum]